MDDPKAFAQSILRMYGAVAEEIARHYLERLKLSRDRKNATVWMEVIEHITARRNASEN